MTDPNLRDITGLSFTVALTNVKAPPTGRYTSRMKTRKALTAFATSAAILCVTAAISAHEVTHNGTVVALKTSKYAQPSGPPREVRELEVTVVDQKTKKPSNRVFAITDQTRLL